MKITLVDETIKPAEPEKVKPLPGSLETGEVITPEKVETIEPEEPKKSGHGSTVVAVVVVIVIVVVLIVIAFLTYGKRKETQEE